MMTEHRLSNDILRQGRETDARLTKMSTDTIRREGEFVTHGILAATSSNLADSIGNTASALVEEIEELERQLRNIRALLER